MNVLYSLATVALFAANVPTSRAHMSMWSPSMYGFDDSYNPVTPLANKPFDQWWFHGYANKSPKEVMSIYPGQNLNIEIACSKSYSTFGNSPSADGCPGDSGSFHAGGSTGSGSGWSGNSESNLMGCALAIAPKSKASDVRPEDFVVMSVQENCVRQRDTPFAIPANLPSCPNGECTCAWFWQGKNSAAEMYMIGFRCKVENGVASAWPTPAKPKRGAIKGATQPMYWANDNSNLDYSPGWDDRPSYNSRFGWSNGAQTSAFGAGGSTANTGTGNTGNSGSGNAGASASTTSRSSAPTSSAWRDDDAESSSSSTRRWRSSSSSSSQSSTASEGRPTQWNQHLAEGEATSTTSTAARTTAAPTTSAAAPKKTKVCRRGHLKRRSRNHI